MTNRWEENHDGDDNPVAARFRRVPKFVASRTLERADGEGATIIRDVPTEVAALKASDIGGIQVHGGGDLVQTLLREDLVDELTLWVFPVVLGTGRRLFAEGTTPSAMELVDTTVSTTGVAIHTYRRVGVPEVGSFLLDDR